MWSGPIGSVISGAKNRGLKEVTADMILPNFKPIKGDVCYLEPEYLQNNDIRNLHTMMIIVQGGPSLIKEDFKITPGPVNLARWVTTATNILCLYVITEDPSDELVLFVEFILRVYGPTICDIKRNWHVSCGPVNFYKSIERSRNLFKSSHPNVWEAVQVTFQTNGFWAHIENVLLAMVCDPNPSVRKEAIDIIQDARERKQKSRAKTVRKFIVPDIDFEATNYHSLIDLTQYKPVQEFVSPPILNPYSIEDIKQMNFSDNFKCIASHQQHVERWVANTSQAAKYAVGQERRHQFLLNQAESFAKVSTEPTIQQFMNILKQNQHLEKNKDR